ncbi:inner membrane protease subunit 1-like protein [Cricetulus griseus]|uniref:Mitochondrial inner membrane protease subunit 2 n=1 Tax=Cricetulus griseus TaxID=10029 RepID=A0A061I6P8_CRIGR|nr:inner membrane protease subunit 1-like protein [Cricetulus griseus]
MEALRSPKNPEQKIIKRVIALEGDIVKTIGHKNRLVKVPRGHMWVEGDHHGHSFDSNAFGPVSQLVPCFCKSCMSKVKGKWNPIICNLLCSFNQD